jgi:hypothetical protein
VKFLVQLNDFEGGTSTVPLFFGKFVPLVQAAFAVLLLDTHNGEVDRDIRESQIKLYREQKCFDGKKDPRNG